MKITKILMVETGSYNDMVVRPYQSHLNDQAVNIFREITHDGTNLSAETLGGFAGNILRPSGQVRGMANIENGWGERRLRFLMEIEDNSGFGGGVIHICTGYTNHVGATLSGAVDPSMKMYFNNHIKVGQTTIRTPGGMTTQLRVADASQIIPGSRPSYDYGWQQQQQPSQLNFLMRPEDVVNNMFANTLNDPEVVDLRSTTTAGPKQSRRDNALAPVYMSRTLKALSSAYSSDDGLPGGTVTDVYEKAGGAVRESTLTADNFFGRLMMSTGFGEQNFITYGEFCAMFPEADHLNNIMLRGEMQRMPNPNTIVSERGQTEHWNGSNNETIAATILAHAVPALMMDLMITGVVFHATNQTLNGQIEVQVQHAHSFSKNLNMSPYMARLIERLQVEVLRDISRNNEIDFGLSMSVDVVGDTMISISLYGQPTVDYVIPSFCDALLAPVVGGSAKDLRTLGHDLDMLYSNAETHHLPVGMQDGQHWHGSAPAGQSQYDFGGGAYHHDETDSVI